jgi:hypothetical protein
MPTVSPKQPKAFQISHTKLATFRRCLQQYHWKYIDGYYPPSTIGQARGTAGHAALAVWHREYAVDASLDAAWKVWELNLGTAGDDWQLLEASLTRYFDWSLNNHDNFKILQSEQEFQIEFEVPHYTLPGKEKGKITEHTSVVLTGFIDGIVEEKGQIWLLENKFYKRMDRNPLDLDPQVSMYLLAANLLGYPAQGVIYNIIRVADTKIALTEPVVRRRLHRNLQGLDHIQEEMLLQVDRMIEYQKGGVPYRTPTKDCHWDCPFYSACILLTDDGLSPTNQLISITNIRSENADQETIEQETSTGW